MREVWGVFMSVKRIFVEKKKGFDVEAQGLYRDIKYNLGVSGLESVRILNRYDMEGVSGEEFEKSVNIVFAEPPVDLVYEEEVTFDEKTRIIAIEYLPGQYDQRADSASQCMQILTKGERPEIRNARLIALNGSISENEFLRIKNYCINPVESHEAALAKPQTLQMEIKAPQDVKVFTGFTRMTEEELHGLMKEMGLAMSMEDLLFCRNYFCKTENRDPSMTEIRLIDTYWSDHCRHTTFLTEIEDVEIEDGFYSDAIKEAYQGYLKTREFIYEGRQKDVCLMDLATVAMKELRKRGLLEDLDVSDEINACSIVVDVDIDGANEEWLVMFKNETHNHPTEIEPFGGAATCLGGAIRDPLSGRAYVYQAMRVTGSGDPRTKVEDTLAGKLPQRKITTGAAAGYSSYGNQIGLATGQVAEVYHRDYVAKRMEIGAVIGAAPKKNVVRQTPEAGDMIILLGGRTGRDGCGGATGSSKEHTEESLMNCGAEVQKGNPPTERKIQRLFRNPTVSTRIKKCNDFGAGGVSVAIGELADGLSINLDAVPKKYEGLDGTELAISESQERMAVVVAPENVEAFLLAAREENLEATQVAVVTGEARLRMLWRGKTIVDIAREFLDTHGAKQKTAVKVTLPDKEKSFFAALPAEIRKSESIKERWAANLQRLNVCSQKGLVERFDSTIGAGTVLMPFGGKYQLSPAEGMAAKIPVLTGHTNTGTLMAFGFNPDLAQWSPFHGAVYAVVESIVKIAAMGGDYRKIRLTLQEYFEKLGKDTVKWGKPFSALLGAYYAQMRLKIPAIGGKDSMSGTFREMNVPPTLVSFAVAAVDVNHVVSAEFKEAGSKVVVLPLKRDANELPDFEQLEKNCTAVHTLVKQGFVLSAGTVKAGGIAETISKMSFGNGIGFRFYENSRIEDLFRPEYGSLVLEMPSSVKPEEVLGHGSYELLGETLSQPNIRIQGQELSLEWLAEKWQQPLESIFPTKAAPINGKPILCSYEEKRVQRSSVSTARPRVFIPVFPGTNCEYDTARIFEQAGAAADIFVVRNLTPEEIEKSMKIMVKKVRNSQIIMIPGGFSGGDEPDGSGKFIATAFRNPYMKEAVMELLSQRDGLMLGICNGFQALIKLGLVPYGEIRDIDEESPTLTFNTIGRHASGMVRTRIASTRSPWFNNVNVGDLHTIAVSHGEGRFYASDRVVENLVRHGQVATQYVDLEGEPTYDIRYNPNGSVLAIEGITSPDGRVLGKMGHSERIGTNVVKNVPGEKDQRIFEAGVAYFK